MSYTSEHNIVVFTSRQTDEVAAGPSKDSKDPSMLTRSKSSAINWSACLFCSKKSYKQDKRLLKIESDERVTRISTAANYYGDSTMLFKISHDSFKEQAFYHNQCMTKYLVGVKQESEVNDNSSSDIEAAFSQLVNDISEDLLKSKKGILIIFFA